MKSLFQYNWKIRDEWFQCLELVPITELLKERNTGVGSIFKTLFHIIDVEYSWIRALQNKTDLIFDINEYKDINSLNVLSDELRIEVKEYIDNWSSNLEFEVVTPSWIDRTYYKGEILRHIIVHEIHHTGQLSIWSKEIGMPVVSSNFIGRDLI
ncbi:DNA damage-inducible protein DinB [Paenibacillus montaniterrae]|uniref:DNA damage-inducible protein DinB n=1 Tax=Paenibacillus montaniterrae TaxID=429341 RepID=A0A919YSG5_9BACL|nr:DinB family protein [Paenibacillus montaniterrae]GIP17519.1 DNA damage-inducible protein DinB [Paenibacillus montaniterrae]